MSSAGRERQADAIVASASRAGPELGTTGVGPLPLRLDCRHFRGDRPCAAGVGDHAAAPGFCRGNCPEYVGLGTRILIIKLAALGDVVRTAALLPGLKERWPQSQITWVTRPAGVRVLAHHPLIDRLLPLNTETLCHLEHECFDLCLSLDKEPGPAALALRVRPASGGELD